MRRGDEGVYVAVVGVRVRVFVWRVGVRVCGCGVCGYVWVCVACVVWGCVSCSDSMGSVFSRMILIILYIDCIYFGGHFRSKVNLGSDCLFFYSKML